MARPKRDPLIAAMIAKLPESGDWPVEQQVAWLHLMAMAFGVTYGGEASARLTSQTLVTRPAVLPESALPPRLPGQPRIYDFYIDTDGIAKSKSGKPIKAKDVKGDLYDLRGELGDMKTIQWADGSTGLNGADLTIIAV